MSAKLEIRDQFRSELDEISPNIPWEGIGFDNPGTLLLVDPYYKYLHSPVKVVFCKALDGAIIMEGTSFVSGDYNEYWLTSEELVKNLVAYVDEDGAICCFNPEVVNDVLPESTEAFSEVINQETKKEAAKEATQQSLSVKPDQRPSWMP